ncbi:MAG: FAD-dependent oxidoreductase [bacterium]
MDTFKYVIIGGGAAGVTAAEEIRKIDIDGSIALVCDEPYVLYSRVMLSKPNFFLGKVPFEQVWLRKEDWFKKNKVTFLKNKTATHIDSANKILSLLDGTKVKYDKLLLATGVSVRRLTVPGADKKGIHYLRTIDDGKAIMQHIKNAKNAVVVGGGFIGFEMADLFKLAGLNTTMIIREQHFWSPTLDGVSGQMIEDALTKNGVHLIKNNEIAEIKGIDFVESIVLKDGTEIPCDLLMCGIGVVNNTKWIAESGITVNKGIVTDEYLQTSASDIWSAGDIAEYKDILLEENVIMGNWVNAVEQGRVAGRNMTGAHDPFKFVSFYTTQGFGISIAFVGDVAYGANRVVLPRGSKEINSYSQVVMVGDELVGATMINRTGELTTFSKIIKNNIKVADKHSSLSDPNFDLKTLV